MRQTSIGKVDEILGPINQVYFTIKPQEGIQATSFKSGDKFYIGGDKLLPLEKYGFRQKRWEVRVLIVAQISS
jgi:H/ACA ribonucleoprotein complex subunit 1